MVALLKDAPQQVGLDLYPVPHGVTAGNSTGIKDAFQKAGLDLYLAPYGVLPTAYECGIIEVVPEASSRSALGETSDAGLYEIFQREFGAPGTESFEIARHNFILSSAG